MWVAHTDSDAEAPERLIRLTTPLSRYSGRGVGGEGILFLTPHPQPLSPEYRGEGDNATQPESGRATKDVGITGPQCRHA
jgi:hypothetical protein